MKRQTVFLVPTRSRCSFTIQWNQREDQCRINGPPRAIIGFDWLTWLVRGTLRADSASSKLVNVTRRPSSRIASALVECPSTPLHSGQLNSAEKKLDWTRWNSWRRPRTTKSINLIKCVASTYSSLHKTRIMGGFLWNCRWNRGRNGRIWPCWCAIRMIYNERAVFFWFQIVQKEPEETRTEDHLTVIIEFLWECVYKNYWKE